MRVCDFPDCYDVIYILKPIREVEPGWWKLKWRPLWKHTIYLWWSGYHHGLGLRWWRSDARNGWHRSYKHFYLEISLPFGTYNFWLRWDFVVHKDGPSDVAEKNKKPLVLPR